MQLRKTKLIVAGTLTALLSSSAFAADPILVASPSGFDWTGFYVGAVAGGGWGTSDHTDANGVTTGDFSQSGFVIGGTVGYNWQHDSYVFGIEADLAFSTIGETINPLVCGNPCFTDLEAFGTLRPRLGYAFDRYMLYVTGGLAFGNVEYGQVTAIRRNSLEVGWTIGAGLEAQLDRNWSLKAEYLYTELSEGRYNLGVPARVEQSASIVRVGLNYRFGGSLF